MMSDIKTVSDLSGWDRNPRRISKKSSVGLGKCMDEFGDISGLTYNVRTGRLFIGHQCKSQLPDDSQVIHTEDFTDEKDTIGYGYALGTRWPVRFVD